MCNLRLSDVVGLRRLTILFSLLFFCFTITTTTTSVSAVEALSSPSSSSSKKANTRKRILFLHGQFVTPNGYEKVIATKFLSKLREDGWEIDMPLSSRVCQDPVPDFVKDKFKNFGGYDTINEYNPEWLNAETHENDNTKTYHGLSDALNFLKKYLLDNPNKYDIIGGHSNGALMATILVYMIESTKNTKEPFLSDEEGKSNAIKGLLICNAPNSFETECTIIKQHIEKFGNDHKPIISTIPSIHLVSSSSDFAYQGSLNLLNVHFPNVGSKNTPTIIDHDEGHGLPMKETNDKLVYEKLLLKLNEMMISDKAK